MSKNYTQLSLEQRYQIQAFLVAKKSKKFIAEKLGVHPSTISREIARNTAKRGRTALTYCAKNAHRKTIIRHTHKPKNIILNTDMKETIAEQLRNDKWSPEIINRVALLKGNPMVSHERIYQWIWDCKKGNKTKDRKYKRLYEYLRHGKRRRKRGKIKDSRGIIPNRVPIDKRPKIVEKRKRLGDLEVDLMIGKNHQGALLTIIDRATLFTCICKVENRESHTILKTGIKMLKKMPFDIKTITFDNDKAFSMHQEIGTSVKAKTYFTRPYTSQDKGSVENRIGVIRRFFPKKTDLTFVNEQDVKIVEQNLNNRPVRKFNYLTPKQVLQQKIALIT